jgi:aryl-alcohol dehydrogenase-like predicted oxidoreductase
VGELRDMSLIEQLESFKREGLTRYIGYSGDGDAARFAVETGRFDALQTSVSIADQEAVDLTLPICVDLNMGVIAKRPLANVAWRGETPDYFPGYGSEYARRLNRLDYSFLRRDDVAVQITAALGFTLAQHGVHVAIVGTKKPGRYEENLDLLEQHGPGSETISNIRTRWREIAEPNWYGQR